MTPAIRSWLALIAIALAGCADVSPPGVELAPGGNDAPEQLRYGAIAFSDSTQVWRIRWNVADRERAGALALSNCGESDCRTILTFGPGQCGTFSLGDGGALGVGAGPGGDGRSRPMPKLRRGVQGRADPVQLLTAGPQF